MIKVKHNTDNSTVSLKCLWKLQVWQVWEYWLSGQKNIIEHMFQEEEEELSSCSHDILQLLYYTVSYKELLYGKTWI